MKILDYLFYPRCKPLAYSLHLFLQAFSLLFKYKGKYLQNLLSFCFECIITYRFLLLQVVTGAFKTTALSSIHALF